MRRGLVQIKPHKYRLSGGRLVSLMRVQDLPRTTRFMFWCTAPFLVATIVLLPLLARPQEAIGWIVLAAVDVLAILVLFGLYNPALYWWCWRGVGAIVFLGYLAYLISMVITGQFFGDGRRSSATALNAMIGLIVFGYPGFMYAVFGRFTWRSEPEYDPEFDACSDIDDTEDNSG